MQINQTGKGGGRHRNPIRAPIRFFILMGFLLPFQNASGQDTSTALAGSWNFDEASGIAVDQSSGGNSLSVGLCARVPGATGNGVLIGPGSNWSVNIANQGSLGDFSIFFSVKYQNIDSSTFENIAQFTPLSMFMVRREATVGFSSWIWNTNTPGWETRVSSGSVPATNTWYHVLVTRSNTNFSIYVNGLLRSQAAHTSNLISPATISMGSSGTSSYTFDNLKIYKRSLSSNDALSLVSPIPTATITNATNFSKCFPGTVFRGTNISPTEGFANFQLLISNLSGGTPWALPATRDTASTWSACPTFPGLGSYDVSLALTNNGLGGLGYLSPPTRITLISPVRLGVKVVSAAGAPVPGARVFLVAGSPNDSGIRVANETGLAVYTNMMPGTTLFLTNFAPRLMGLTEVGTNLTAADADDTLVWVVPTSAPIVPTPTTPAYYFTGSAQEIVIGVPPNRYTIVSATGLNGGRRHSLFEGFTTGSTVRLDKNLFQGLPSGMVVLETKSSRMGEDDHRSTFTRQLCFLVR